MEETRKRESAESQLSKVHSQQKQRQSLHSRSSVGGRCGSSSGHSGSRRQSSFLPPPTLGENSDEDESEEEDCEPDVDTVRNKHLIDDDMSDLIDPIY
jgi:hypothetical protein